jgi:DNA-directed RNA polymerase specialized sigma24 family protein
MATSTGPKNLTHRVNEATPSAMADVDRLFRDRLRNLVRHEMGRRFRRSEGSEDVVQEALWAFYRAVADRRTQLDHSGGLWPLLKQFTHHKIMQHVEHHLQQIRNVAKQRQIDLAKFPLAVPTETDAVQLIDQLETAVRRLLRRQGMKPRDAEILRSKLRGESSKQTAQALECSVATVNRTLAVLLPQLEELLEKQMEIAQEAE